MKSKINKLFAWLIVFLLVIGLAGFGLQDVISRWGTSKIAAIGEKEISTEEFVVSFNQELNYLSRMLGQNISIQDAKNMGLHLRVLERLINTSLLDQMLKDLQISTGNKFLLQSLKRNPNFKDQAGKFSREKYNLYLDRLNLSEKDFENILRTDLTRGFILQGFDSPIVFNSNISNLITQYASEERLVSIYKANDKLAQVERTTSMEKLEGFFNQNKDRYKTAQIRKVSYLKLDPTELAKKIKVSEEELLETFLARKNDYQKPELRQLNKIVFSKEADATLAYKEIINQSKNFDKVAEERNLSKADVAYGTFAKDQLQAEVGEIVFSEKLAVGSVVGPIVGDLGYEIIEISKIIASENIDFSAVKETLKKELSFEKAQEMVLSMMPDLEDMIAAGESLETISDTFSIEIKSLDWSGDMVPPQPFNRQDFNSLVNSATAETSDIVELDSGALLTIRLDNEILPKIPKFNDVLNQVSNDLFKRDLLSALEKKVTSTLSQLQSTDLSDTLGIDKLFEERLTRQSLSEYIESDTLNQIFGAKEGDLIVKPLLKGNVPYLLIIKINMIIPGTEDQEKFQKFNSAIQDQLSQEVNREIQSSMINGLRQLYKPKVNLKMVDQIISNLQ